MKSQKFISKIFYLEFNQCFNIMLIEFVIIMKNLKTNQNKIRNNKYFKILMRKWMNIKLRKKNMKIKIYYIKNNFCQNMSLQRKFLEFKKYKPKNQVLTKKKINLNLNLEQF